MNTHRKIFILTVMLAACFQWKTFASPNHYINILDHGAVPDGETLNTGAIQSAVDICAREGGSVYIPKGDFVTGTIYFKDNVTIYIEAGATILGSADINDYPKNNPDYKFYGQTWVKQSLFYAENCTNVTIEGRGTIDGQGEAFQVTTKKKPDRYMNRPYVLWFIKCTNVKIDGITLKNSAMWMQHYMACDFVTINNITVYNHANKNNDMIDVDGCKNVIISNCYGDTDDDAMTFKSLSGRLNENITVTNCILSSHVNALKFGTETSGGFKNVTISNIVIRPSQKREVIYGRPDGICGISLLMVDGGMMDGINISNVQIDGPEVPFFIRLGNRGRKYKEEQENPGVGVLKNIHLSNITAKNVGTIGASITGIPGHRVENITLDNIHIEYAGGGTHEDALKNIPELEDAYPESTIFGNLNSYGVYIRHAQNLRLEDIRLLTEESDLRPAVVMDNAVNVSISGLHAEIDEGIPSFIRCRNAKNINIRDSQVYGRADSFITVEGAKSESIVLEGNNLSNTKKEINVANGADYGEITSINNVEP